MRGVRAANIAESGSRQAQSTPPGAGASIGKMVERLTAAAPLLGALRTARSNREENGFS